MPSGGFSWGPKLSDIADAVWTRSERRLTNLDDIRASKIDNIDVAVSTRATEEGVWTYSERKLTKAVSRVFAVISDNLRVSADSQKSVNTTTATKVKEIFILHDGMYRVKFDLRSGNSGYVAHGRIYRNGAAYGSSRSSDTTSYTTFSEDLNLRAGDFLQLYIWVSTSGKIAYVRNLRLYFDYDLTIEQFPIVVLN